jgi:hypothetical protein
MIARAVRNPERSRRLWSGIVAALIPAVALASSSREQTCRALRGSQPSITVHGRLYAANGGGSGFRIWIVGTTRIVWLTPKIEPAIPEAIRTAFTPFDQQLYGDFTLVPLTPDRPGVMREVCLVSGGHLVARRAAP